MMLLFYRSDFSFSSLLSTMAKEVQFIVRDSALGFTLDLHFALKFLQQYLDQKLLLYHSIFSIEGDSVSKVSSSSLLSTMIEEFQVIVGDSALGFTLFSSAS